MATKATAKGAASRKRRERKNIDKGAAHIQSTFNNTILMKTSLNSFIAFVERQNNTISYCPIIFIW